MRHKLSGLSIAALVGVVLAASPASAGISPMPSDAPVHLTQSWLKLKNFKRPVVLPPNPCRGRLCTRPRPR